MIKIRSLLSVHSYTSALRVWWRTGSAATSLHHEGFGAKPLGSLKHMDIQEGSEIMLADQVTTPISWYHTCGRASPWFMFNG